MCKHILFCSVTKKEVLVLLIVINSYIHKYNIYYREILNH